ncbi:MAG: glycoside hydrolase family 20 zincin-like fold domain-containing protein [Bacteroidota bacterium]|nr:glycoside hydrolase family 20 zincin-like fold domain-containing protein [Bacteroidota bacterium]
MKIITKSISITAALLFLASCTPNAPETPTDLTQTSFIPQPASVNTTGDAFTVSASTVVYYQAGAEGLQHTADYLAGHLGGISGLNIIAESAEKEPSRGIYLEITGDDPELGNEGYELNIGKKLLTMRCWLLPQVWSAIFRNMLIAASCSMWRDIFSV